MHSLNVSQFIAAYNASLANVLELRTATVTGVLEPRNDKLYAGELYWSLVDGGSRVTVRIPDRYRDLTRRRVEVTGQPYRQTKDDRGQIEVVLRVRTMTPLDPTPEDWIGPHLHIGEKRRTAWPSIERAIESRILAGDRPRLMMLIGPTSIVEHDVLGALGQHAAAYQIMDYRIPLTDSSAVAAAIAHHKQDTDLIVVVRGGGEGISALSDPQVLDAVAQASVPIVSAVGHEVDRPLIQDLVHHAFSTPTAMGSWLAARATGATRARDAIALDHMRQLEAMQRQMKDVTEALAAAKLAETAANESAARAREETGTVRLQLLSAKTSAEAAVQPQLKELSEALAAARLAETAANESAARAREETGTVRLQLLSAKTSAEAAVQPQLKELSDALAAARLAETAARESAARAREEAGSVRLQLQSAKVSAEDAARKQILDAQVDVGVLRRELQLTRGGKELADSAKQRMQEQLAAQRRRTRFATVLLVLGLLAALILVLLLWDELPGLAAKLVASWTKGQG